MVVNGTAFRRPAAWRHSQKRYTCEEISKELSNRTTTESWPAHSDGSQSPPIKEATRLFQRISLEPSSQTPMTTAAAEPPSKGYLPQKPDVAICQNPHARSQWNRPATRTRFPRKTTSRSTDQNRLVNEFYEPWRANLSCLRRSFRDAEARRNRPLFEAFGFTIVRPINGQAFGQQVTHRLPHCSVMEPPKEPSNQAVRPA
jgi:hypothetical protein